MEKYLYIMRFCWIQEMFKIFVLHCYYFSTGLANGSAAFLSSYDIKKIDTCLQHFDLLGS